MTKDKLAWLKQPVDGLLYGLPEFAHVDRRLDALDAALRAQLMHVAIGLSHKGPGRPTKLLVDFCVYVSLRKPESETYIDVARAMVLIEAKRHRRPIRFSRHGSTEPLKGKMIITRSFCTTSPSSYCELMSPTIGEPLTLQIMFDAKSERVAQLEATQLCDRFSHWNTPETTIPAAVKRIQDAIVDRAAGGGTSSDLLYKTASISAGWKSRVSDTSALLWCGAAAQDHVSGELPDVLRAFCFNRLEEIWNDTAKFTGLFDTDHFAEPPADETNDAITYDFVDTKRLMGALFGERQPRKLR